MKRYIFTCGHRKRTVYATNLTDAETVLAAVFGVNETWRAKLFTITKYK